MNNNDKSKNDNLELDELNIKSHLNTSLDLSGISVSEDLINRTLAAIKEQSNTGKEEETKTSPVAPEKKIVAWNRYIRGFAGVAAAVIIVVIGYNIVQQIPMGMKSAKDSATPELTTAMDSSTEMPAAEMAPAEENQTFDASLAMEPSEDIQYTITAEAGALEEASNGATSDEGLADSTAADEAEMAAANESSDSTARNTETVQKFTAKSGNPDDEITYSFREIFIPTPEQAEYITITDNQNNTSITLTTADDINVFYSVMDQHQFSNMGDESLIDPNYTVEMNSPEMGTLYTMLVGSNLTVRYTQGESIIETVYYAVDDAVFKQELTDFFNEYSE